MTLLLDSFVCIIHLECLFLFDEVVMHARMAMVGLDGFSDAWFVCDQAIVRC